MSSIVSHWTPGLHCPVCNEIVDAHSNAEGGDQGPAQDGDVAVCIFCTAFLMFTDDAARVVELPPDEWAELDTYVQEVLLQARAYFREHKLDKPQ